MNSDSNSCDNVELTALLAADEDSDVFHHLSQHVDACEKCQRKLLELSGDQAYWQRQREMLQPLEGDGPDSGFLARYHSSEYAIDRQQLPVEDALREILSPPSHPEMLGRLGRYEIERVIGAGGMGVVLKAFDTELNRPVAIKVLARHLATSGTARARFAREAKAAAAVVHEHVVAIHNVEADRDHPFLVMQFVSGDSLQTRVDLDGPLDSKEILRIGIQTAAGLAAAHEQGVVHRDVKPANILLENGVERVLLTDFGLARTVDDASLTQTGVIAGTPHYMSPEQANGQPTDRRTDLFSLGAVLYFMATGHPPFRAESAMGVLNRICHARQRPLWQVNTDIADELSVLVDRLLEKQPGRRIPSAEAARVALVELLAQMQQPKNSLRRRVRRFTIRHPKTNIAAGVATLTVTISALVALLTIPAKHANHANESSTRQTAAVSELDSSVPPLFDTDESAEFATSMVDLRQRVDSLNAPGVFATTSNSNDNESPSLQSLHQRLERLHGNSETESPPWHLGEMK